MQFPQGRVRDRFDRKGHEFVVLDVLLRADPDGAAHRDP